jgi:hypothetical protein
MSRPPLTLSLPAGAARTHRNSATTPVDLTGIMTIRRVAGIVADDGRGMQIGGDARLTQVDGQSHNVTSAGDFRDSCRLCMRCGVDGEFVVAGQGGTARVWCLSCVGLLCTGRVACGALAGSQIRALARRRDKERSRSAGQQVIVARATCEDGLVPGRVAPVESEPAGWTWHQGPGQRASSVGGTGPGSRRPQRAAGRRARCQRGQHRQASLLRWWSRNR